MIVFGGTFDPVHHGHLQGARHVSETLGGTTVVLMPAPVPQLRNAPEASFEHRWQMSQLACEQEECLVASCFENQRKGPTRTVETLQALSSESDGKLVWVLGSDAFSNISNWYRFEELPSVASLFVLVRPFAKQSCIPTGFMQVYEAPRLLERPGLVYVSRTKMLNVSATIIRVGIRNGDDVSQMLPQEILEHIMQHRLYQS